MLVVIDTNVLLVSVSTKSKYHWLFQLVVDKKIQVAFTHEILTEYEEQFSIHWNPIVATDITRTLTELSTAFLTTIYYNLNLITLDADDNKFVDCAFAANADFIITNDSHFNILKTIDFPSIPTVTIEEFKTIAINGNLL
ncbi:MAG TPA: putative toxin-antitoxin system toxin component, PIN family [Mucilaginibacter sp.]